MNIYRVNEENYEKAAGWSRHADTRASIILAFNAALVALLVTDNPYTHDFIYSFRHDHTAGHTAGAAVFLLFLAAFTAGSVLALRVLMLDARKTRCEHNNLFSFMNITDMPRAAYRDALMKVNEQSMLHALQDQTYLMAQLARRKLTLLSAAWVALGCAIACAVSFVVVTVFLA